MYSSKHYRHLHSSHFIWKPKQRERPFAVSNSRFVSVLVLQSVSTCLLEVIEFKIHNRVETCCRHGARWVGREKWICGAHFKQGPTIKSTVRAPLGLDFDADDRGDIFFRVNCFVKSVDKPRTLGTKNKFPADTPKTNKKRYPYWLLASLVYLPCFAHKLATIGYHLCYNHAMWLLLSSLTSLLTKSSAHQTMPTARAWRNKWCQRLPACIRV